MRTTLRIDDQLLKEAKQYAMQQGCTLTKLMEQALRETLARNRKGQQPSPVKLNTVNGEGLQPGIDLDDSAALLEDMDDRHDINRR